MSAGAGEMDLNASPEPEEEEDPFLKRRLEPRAESAVEIARRVPFDSLYYDACCCFWMIYIYI